MSILNPADIVMAAPDYGQDQIIGIFTNTLSVAAPTITPGYTITTDTKSHGFGDSCYFDGIFSVDGGITWNEFGTQTPNLTTPGAPVFDTVDCEAYVDTANVNISVTNFYDFTHSKGTTYTLQYKIYLIAKNKMAQPLTSLKTNNILTYNTAQNIQKIFIATTVAINVASGATGFSGAIAHNLGYVPKIRAFFLPTATPATVFPLNQTAIPPTTPPQIEAHITATSLVFFCDSSAGVFGLVGNIEARVYLDS